jgi:Fe-S-cluster containining protein
MSRQPLPLVTSCDQCGACCTGQAALPLSMVSRYAAVFVVNPLPEALAAELLELVAHFNAIGWPADDTPCIWYDAPTKRCRHYEYRPGICRDLEIGSDACHRWRRQLGLEPRTVWTSRGGRLVRETR